MSSTGLPPMITSQEMKILLARNGFSQAQKGSRDFINQFAEECLESSLKQAMLQADYQGRSGLNKEHAQKAMEHTVGFPKGSY